MMRFQRPSSFFSAAAFLLLLAFPASLKKPADVVGMSFLPTNASTSVTVGRPDPFTDLQNLEDDVRVNAVTSEIKVFCSQQPPEDFSGQELKQHLMSAHQNVQVAPDQEEYYYIIEPDGTMRRRCTTTIVVSIYGAEIVPVKVWITETVTV
jgi:hypothetical protein